MADITIVLMGFINQFITKGHHIVVGFGWDDWNAWDELMSTGHWMFNYVNMTWMLGAIPISYCHCAWDTTLI